MKTSVLLLLWLCATPALAFEHAFSEDGITGNLTSAEDGVVTATCVMPLDRPPADVAAVLRDHDHLGRWMPDTLEFRVLQHTKEGARFYRKINTPFFAPDMWFTLDASITTDTPALTRVEWHRVDGSNPRFDAVWEIIPLGTGSQVTYRVTTQPPSFAPPPLVKRMASKTILNTMRALRKETGKR